MVKIFSVIFVFCFIFISNESVAQYQRFGEMNQEKVFPWKDGKRCAVSLTFDDARRSQVNVGMAFLKKHNVNATFYVVPRAMRRNAEQWKQMIADGHELANHTLSHPCSGNYAFTRENPLEEFTLEKIAGELDGANRQLLEQFGVNATSFAYPCGHSFVGRGTGLKSYVPLVAEMFTSGRGWLGESTNDPWFCDLAQLQGIESDNQTYDELLNWVQSAERDGRWLVLAGHEIGMEGNQTTLVPELEKLFEYLFDEENNIWVDTVGNVAQHVLNVRENETSGTEN